MTLGGGPTVVKIDLLMLLLSSPPEPEMDFATGRSVPSVSGTLERSIRTVSGMMPAADVCFLANIKISSMRASLGPELSWRRGIKKLSPLMLVFPTSAEIVLLLLLKTMLLLLLLKLYVSTLSLLLVVFLMRALRSKDVPILLLLLLLATQSESLLALSNDTAVIGCCWSCFTAGGSLSINRICVRSLTRMWLETGLETSLTVDAGGAAALVNGGQLLSGCSRVCRSIISEQVEL